VLTSPFRGSRAIACGLVTAKQLRGARYVRLFPDVYADASLELTYSLRSRAAYLLVQGRGVLSGYSAAQLLGAGCGPPDADAEVLVPEGDLRRHPGLRVHRGRLFADETCEIDGIVLTAPLFTAWTLACRGSLVDAVVAVDALAHVHGLDPRDVVRLGYRRVGARGSRRLPEVVRLANPLSGSPMETRIRLSIVLAGLPPPVLQHPVGPYFLDMAYPELMLGIEYDGRDHLNPDRALRDLTRAGYFAGAAGTCSAFPPARSTGPVGSLRRSRGRSPPSGRQRPARDRGVPSAPIRRPRSDLRAGC
jgi:hypothetical protein